MAEKEKRILVVDDQEINIDILENLLDKQYTVLSAMTGMQALRIAQSNNPPDLILLDIVMPELDGFEVCKRLKSDSRTNPIPVVFITTQDEIDDKMDAYEYGAADYITKPIDPDIVLSTVGKYV